MIPRTNKNWCVIWSFSLYCSLLQFDKRKGDPKRREVLVGLLLHKMSLLRNK